MPTGSSNISAGQKVAAIDGKGSGIRAAWNEPLYQQKGDMSEPSEYSESGNPIYRHEPSDKPPDFAMGNQENIEAISRHIERHLGEYPTVFHEIVSHLVHIDVHFVAPNTQRPYHTLITSGMSDRPMTVPEG